MKDLFNWETLCRACPFLPEANIHFYKICTSTNQLAKEWAKAGGRGYALFVAAAQSAGKGRMGRSFYSPPESGVYFSFVHAGESATQSADLVAVTCAAAVAVMNAVFACCGIQCEIKWVNDLLYQGKKVCGILTEAVTQEDQTAIITGIGVNLRPATFPPEIAEIAGSLEDERTPRATLIAAIAAGLMDFYSGQMNWLQTYRAHSCVLGKRIAFLQNGILTKATAVEITGDGGLKVLTGAGEQILHTGEVTLRLAE